MEPSIDPIRPLSPRSRWEAPQAPADVERDGRRRQENDPAARRRERERERRRRQAAAGAFLDGDHAGAGDAAPGDGANNAELKPPTEPAGGRHIDVRA